MALKRPEGMTDEEFIARANDKARKKKAARATRSWRPRPSKRGC